jgi:hypothetical protein
MRECLETQGHWLENADFLTAVADMAWNMMMRGKPAEGWRWIQAGLERAAVDGVQSRFARGHTYRCYAGPLLAQLGRSAEGRQHLDAYREILRGVSDDRWRHGQWLAHRSLFLVVSGAFGDELEEAFAAFGALRLSPRTLPLQLRHFYVAQAMARAHQLKAAGVNPPRSVQRCWSEAREALAQAASHATLRGHLRALEAGVALHQSSHRRASRLLAEAERLARETENAWILSETSSLRAVMRRDADR